MSKHLEYGNRKIMIRGVAIMMYLLAIVLPPVAILLSGKPGSALLNCLLCLLGWIPGVIHAILVVNEKKADKRSMKQAEYIAKAASRN